MGEPLALRQERMASALTGLSVGDAFGERYFGDPEREAEKISTRWLAEAPWRWTDDTAMAQSICETLSAHGRIDQDELMKRFVARYALDPDRGYGGGAFGLLRNIALGGDWRTLTPALFDGTGSYGNGAAMRAPVIGAYYGADIPAVVHEAMQSALVTHSHDDAVAGAIAVAVCAAYMASSPLTGRALIQAVLDAVPTSQMRVGIAHALGVAADTPVAEVAEALGTGEDVSARRTVPFCLFAAAHHAGGAQPERSGAALTEALWWTVAGLGDRDTTCAIVGGMIAARTGVPSEWIAMREPLADPLDLFA